MIVDTHVHVWEIDPPKYPVGPTARVGIRILMNPAPLMNSWRRWMHTVLSGRCWCKPAGRLGITVTSQIQ